MLGQTKPLKEEEKTAEQIAKEKALVEQRKVQEEFDMKNAAGAAKELKKSEMVDWRNHEKLNMVTKMAIGYFEQSFSFADYLKERTEKESKLQSGKSGKDGHTKDNLNLNGSGDEQSGSDDEEEEEEAVIADWDRAQAE